MKKSLILFFLSTLLWSCYKDKGVADKAGCDINKVYADNSKKVSITNGVWGTVSNIEGDCMPTVPTCNSCSRNCPVQRTVKIFQYTLVSDGVTTDPYKVFFDSFNTQFITPVDTDENGFFQVDLPMGHYTIVIVENGRLYANIRDGQGGLSPSIVTSGINNLNLFMTYKATFKQRLPTTGSFASAGGDE
jgi:hypothetical protein